MDRVLITVDASRELGPMRRIWRSFGYDELNYTYTPQGKHVFREIQKLGDGPFWIRNHFVFSSGNLLSGPARGSTNCYSEDESGRPLYDWSTVDRIYDTFLEHGCKPFIELTFTPHALSTHPETGIIQSERYPPKDYAKWRELNYRLALHLVERYGREEVRTWYFAPWNEPDLSYYFTWKPDEDLSKPDQRAERDEEFFKVFDYAADGIRACDDRIILGGPELAGDIVFLDRFLAHCQDGTNYATGRKGTRLDFLSFHCKGTGLKSGKVANPDFDDLARRRLAKYLSVVRKYPALSKLPVMLDEWDIDVGTFRGLFESRDFQFRNNSYYPTFVIRAMKELSDRILEDKTDIALVTQWAFTFPGMRCFEGTRSLFDPMGIRLPVFNAFEMLARLGATRISASSDDREADIAPGEVVGMKQTWRPRDPAEAETRDEWDRVEPHRRVDALATIESEQVAILVWNQVCDQYAQGERAVSIDLRGLGGWSEAMVRHYRIDAEHSNASTLWQRMGSPDWPSVAQVQALKEREKLETHGPDMRVKLENGSTTLSATLPLHAVSMFLVRRIS